MDPDKEWTPLPVPDLPPRVLIDFATRCNLRCPMCTVWGQEDEAKIDSVSGLMDVEAARRMLDELMAAKPLVQPNMWGEPLLIPNFRERIMDMKSRGMTVAMNTNGLTLTDAVADFLVEARVDSVFFSIDATTRETLKQVRGIDKLEKIEAAVFRLMKARGERDFPRIGVSFTLQASNRHEKDLFVERWAGIVDCVRIGLVHQNGTFPDMPEPPERKPCPALYHTLPVHNDGTVSVCCLDGMRATNMGNALEQGVSAVWQGEEFTKVRYYHETAQWEKVPFCKPCNGWAQYAFEEEIYDGLLVRRSPEYVYYNRIDRLKNWHGNLLGAHPAPAPLSADAS